MNYYLIVYDHASGRSDVTEFAEDLRAEALRRRFDLDIEHRAAPQIEVALLSAPSRESLERTHSRYFKSVRELLENVP
jgi:hypothetical protein